MFRYFENKSILTLFILGLISTGYFLSLITGFNSNLLDILGVAGSLLGGLATVATAVIAYKAYSNWRLQVSSPNSYASDVELVKNLKNIHGKCFAFSDMYGSNIDFIFSQYHQSIINHEVEPEYTYKELSYELESMRIAAREVTELHFLGTFTNEVLHKSNHVFKSNNQPIKELVNYKTHLNYYIFAIIMITKRELKEATVRNYPNMDIMGDVQFNSICCDGNLYRNLQDAYDEVLTHYQKKWDV